MLKELMIHKTVLRLSAFISRNASCWHCYTVITPAAQRQKESRRYGAVADSRRFANIFTLSISHALGLRAEKLVKGGQVWPLR